MIDENEVGSPCKIVLFRHRDTPPAQMLSSSQKAPTYIPDKFCSTDWIRRQLHIVVTKPLKGLAHTPELTEFRKHELNRVTNPSIWVDDDLAVSVAKISDRKPFVQLAAPGFRLLAFQKSLPKDFQLDDTQCSLDAEDQLIVQIVQVINLLVIADEGAKNLANLQKTAPILVRA